VSTLFSILLLSLKQVANGAISACISMPMMHNISFTSTHLKLASIDYVLDILLDRRTCLNSNEHLPILN